MYIYESHMGGLYVSDEYLDYDVLYCDSCGDSDFNIGYAETKEEAYNILKSNYFEEEYGWAYDEEHIQEILSNFEQ